MKPWKIYFGVLLFLGSYVLPGILADMGYQWIIFDQDILGLITADVLKAVAGSFVIMGVLTGWVDEQARTKRKNNRTVKKKVNKQTRKA